jgi:hypothetical protein
MNSLDLNDPQTAETVSKIESSTRQCGVLSDPFYKERRTKDDASRGEQCKPLRRRISTGQRVLRAERQYFTGRSLLERT